MTQSTRHRMLPVFGVLLAAGVLLLLVLSFTGNESVEVSSRSDIYTVGLENLKITIVENGTLAAADRVEIQSEVEGSHRVIYLIPEGTQVETGDKLIELDVSSLLEKKTTQVIAFEKSRAADLEARENFEIQKNQNESDIQAAGNEVLYAQLEIDKFTGKGQNDDQTLMGEREQEVRAAEAKITLAKEELKRAENKLAWSVKLESKGFITRTDREADEMAVTRSKTSLELAKNELAILMDYTHKIRLAKLNARLKETTAEIERVNRRAVARLAQKEAALKSKERQFMLEEERLQKLTSQIEKAVIHAPSPGMVVYADTDSMRHRHSSREEIQEGMDVHERQLILMIPDVASMIVTVDVHENAIHKVKLGQHVTVRVDALSEAVFQGEVSKVAILPSSQGWFASDVKVYRTEIVIHDNTASMRPGLSANVEILVKELHQVLVVPVYAVYRSGKVHYVWVDTSSGPEARVVAVGLHNDRLIHITGGLEADEKVLLANPDLPVPEFAQPEKRKAG